MEEKYTNYRLVAPYDLGVPKAEYRQVLKDVKNWDVVSVDTEITGNFEDIKARRVALLQVSNGEITYTIDCRFIDARSLVSLISKKLCVGHNIKFDYQVIKETFGISLTKMWDTMLAHMIRFCGLHDSNDLVTAVRRYVDPYAYSNQLNLFKPAISKKIRATFASLDADDPITIEQFFYASEDAYYTFHLYHRLRADLEKEDLLEVIEFDNRYMAKLAEMELEGIPIDADKWRENAHKSAANAQAALATLNKQALINWNSWQQVNTMFKDLGIDTTVFDRKTGEIKESVSKTALSKIQHPVVLEYLNYKKWMKLSTAYGEDFLDKRSKIDGKIHTSFQQIMATGRTSSSKPNLQQIPSSEEFRNCFEAPDDYTFIVADFSN